MPILQITNDDVIQRCAVCDSRNELSASDLTPTGEPGAPSGIVALPACRCGAVEFLVRAPKDEPPHPAPGSFGHRHRVLVDAVVDAIATEASDDDSGSFALRVRSRIRAAFNDELFAGELVTEPPPSPVEDHSKNHPEETHGP